MIPAADEQFPPENKDNDPDVVEKERKDFLEFKDKNKDGKLDKQELRELIFPANSNIADNEAQHLLKESDTDKVKSHFLLFILNSLSNVHRDALTSVSPSTLSL